MAILAKCSNCGRLGGYAQSAEDTVCARCKRGDTAPAKDEDENEDEELVNYTYQEKAVQLRSTPKPK